MSVANLDASLAMDSLLVMLIFIAITLEILVLFAKYDKGRRKVELRRIAVDRFCKQAETRVMAINKSNAATKTKLEEMEGRLSDLDLQNENIG